MGNSITPFKPTETRGGYAEVATTAEVALGTDNERVITPLKAAQALVGYYQPTRTYTAGQVAYLDGVWYEAGATVVGETPGTGSNWSLATGSLPVQPANTTLTPAPLSGSGTSADPYVISTVAASVGASGVLVTSVVASSLTPGAFVSIADLNYATNGARFSFTNQTVAGDGTLSFDVLFSDTPVSTAGTTYTLALKIGTGSVYLTGDVSIVSISVPPGGVSMIPAFTGGTGTAGDSYVIAGATSVAGSTGVVVGTYNITGLSPSITVPIQDLNSVANGGRYTFTNANTNSSGVLAGSIVFSDAPVTANGVTYNLNARFGGAAPMTYISHARLITASSALPANATSTPAFSGGSGTAGSPYVVADASSAVGSANTLVATIVQSGFAPGENVVVVDQNAVANGGRFTFTGTTADAGGVMTLVVSVSDSPASPDPTVYTLSLRIGNGAASTYVSHVHTKGTPIVITAPTISSPAANGATGVAVTGPFTTAAFALTAGTDTHLNTDWQIASDSGFTTIVYQSLADAVNKTSITVPALANSTQYYLRARHRGASGVVSSYSATRNFTTVVGIVVATPSITAPTEAATGVSTVAAVTTSAFSLTSGTDTHMNTDWQFASDSGFTTIVLQSLADSTNLVSYTPAASALPYSTTLYARARHRSTTGVVSSYSSTRTFTTAAAPAGFVWTGVTSGTTTELDAVVWSGTKFVTVGGSGKIMTSPDGITWTAQTSGTTFQLNGVAWSGSLFVAVGSGGMIVTSPDGITWTSRTSGSGHTLSSVVWNGSVFVVGGAGGPATVLTSPDGITWTSRSSGTAYVRLGIAWTGSKLVAVGGPAVTTSTDGITWTTEASGTTNSFFDVCWSGSLLVAVGGDSGTGWILTSPDGVTWTSRTCPPTASDLYSVTWSGAQFVAAGTSGKMITSPDGITWTSRTSGTTDQLNGVAWSGTQFLAVGHNGTIISSGTSGGAALTSSITTPSITTPANGSSGITATAAVVTSAFNLLSGTDYHVSTDWQFASDAGFTTIVHQSLANTASKTSYSPSGLAANTTYYVRVKFHGVNSSSAYSSTVSFTTAQIVYSDDVFSTYIYTGNGSTQTINNGIDLAGKGGMVWTKSRSDALDHGVWDTARGTSSGLLRTNTDSVAYGATTGVTAFNSDGFSVDNRSEVNQSSYTYVSWTFRKAARFFDCGTYTGNGVTGRQIPHSLGVAPGMIVVKCTSQPSTWAVYHNGIDVTQYVLALNTTDPRFGATYWNYTAPTSSVFSVSGGGDVNTPGQTYVWYAFAHDTTTDGIIQCGSFTTDGSGNATVNLGWEPQYVLAKMTSGTSDWMVIDSMRGLNVGNGRVLLPNTSSAEYAGAFVEPTATGFKFKVWASSTVVYLAIRRPNKPPTSGAQVYHNQLDTGGGSGSNRIGVTAPFAIDTLFTSERAVGNHVSFDRLRGDNKWIRTSDTQMELENAGDCVFNMNTCRFNTNNWNGNGSVIIRHAFKRAPGVFDVVCYTGTGSATTVAHNLGVAPELMIVKLRSSAGQSWNVYSASTGNTKVLTLNSTSIPLALGLWNYTTPTSSVFSVGIDGGVNTSSASYVAYLFATKAGISKVGSYTGNGGTQTIDCGFTTGARFVLIKRTDSTGDWYVWDTARGIVAGNDPHLSLNTTAAEVTTDDSIDPASTGFIVNPVAATDINVTGGVYIYLAIA